MSTSLNRMGVAVLMSTHNIDKKELLPLYTPFSLHKWGVRGYLFHGHESLLGLECQESLLMGSVDDETHSVTTFVSIVHVCIIYLLVLTLQTRQHVHVMYTFLNPTMYATITPFLVKQMCNGDIRFAMHSIETRKSVGSTH